MLDKLSILFGFLAALVILWLIRRSSTLWPQIQNIFRTQSESLKKRNISAVEENLRKEILKHSQGQHVAWPLFSLDEIAFEPRLLAPPVHVEPGDPLPVDELLSTCLVYMPDWPEFPARFGAATLSFREVLEGGKNIALVGQPGVGKTFSLAYLTSEIARQKPSMGSVSKLFPIFIHASDLQIDNHEGADSLLPIISVLNEIVPVYVLPQVGAFVRGLFTGGTALLLLDGLDEMPPGQIRDFSGYLKAIQRDYPRTRMVVSAPADYLDGLAGLGLYPLTLAGWPDKQYHEFIDRWDHLWVEHIKPEIPDKNLPMPVDPALLTSWLRTECQSWSPLEYTLKIWAAYSGDLKGPAPVDAIESYILRCVPDTSLWPPLERLALQMITTAQPIISRHKVGTWVHEFDHPKVDEELADSKSSVGGSPRGKAEKDTKPGSKLRQSLPDVFNTGLLIENPGDRLSFNHPVITGYLAARALAESENLAALTLQQNWPGKNQALRFLSTLDPSGSIVATTMNEGDEPLFRGVFQAARWLKDAPANLPWRPTVMKRLVDLMQRDNVPTGIRQRAAAALALSGDSNAGTFFRQNLGNSSQSLRQLAILGCGALQEIKALSDLIMLQDDGSRLVRYSACMALAFMDDPSSVAALVQSLYEGDEDLRRAAAESLARNREKGHAALKTGSTSDDLLVRRAIVFGLAQINETWATDILEKLRLEDGQWVVRSAASQALDTLQHGNPRIPKPLPLPSEAGWLITYASQHGVGIAGGTYATEMLLNALKSGTEDERLASLEYLSTVPEEEVISNIVHAIYVDTGIVSEAALVTLWRLALSGATIPSPSAFGIGN
jgi:HEAT repeat protein